MIGSCFSEQGNIQAIYCSCPDIYMYIYTSYLGMVKLLRRFTHDNYASCQQNAGKWRAVTAEA